MSPRWLVVAVLLLTTEGATPFAGPGIVPAPAGPGDAEARKAADDSFLFSSQALALIEAARAGERPKPAAMAVVRAIPAAPDTLHLAAIVYHGPDDWRIWLNGQSFTPAARPRALEILKVTAEAVVLAWRSDPGARPTRVELRPHQTLIVASGEVVEGNPGSGR